MSVVYGSEWEQINRMQAHDEWQERMAKEKEAKDMAERQIAALERVANALDSIDSTLKLIDRAIRAT